MSKWLSTNTKITTKMRSKRRIEYDIAYMNMAESFGNLSQALRNKVGCIIVSENDQIIGQGFNGTPTGYDNCCEYEDDEGNLITKKEVLHAETNAISKCAKFIASTNNSTLYVTLSPCFDCAKIIIQCGIKRVVFKDLYRNTDGLEILDNCNIIVEQLDIENKKLIRYGRSL